MAEKWKLTAYCDKCHCGMFFEGDTPGNCAYQAQKEGWIYKNEQLLCDRCFKKGV